MSFIRYGQDGTYVDIPGGSNYYIYGNSNGIDGWSEAEFAALIGSLTQELDYNSEQPIKEEFTNHFGGWDPDYNGGIRSPERGEIFCQCVDSRINSLTLTDELQEAVQEWVES